MSKQIPKAEKLFRGDINDAVIRVQKMTGIHIDEAWWRANVGAANNRYRDCSPV